MGERRHLGGQHVQRPGGTRWCRSGASVNGAWGLSCVLLSLAGDREKEG